jgi:hypothetical protein
MSQRILEPDRREGKIYKELGAQAGLGGKRGREYSADEGSVSKRRRSRASSQSSFMSLGSAVGGSVRGVENVYKHGIDLDEEEAEEITLATRQVNDREPSATEEDDSMAGETRSWVSFASASTRHSQRCVEVWNFLKDGACAAVSLSFVGSSKKRKRPIRSGRV